MIGAARRWQVDDLAIVAVDVEVGAQAGALGGGGANTAEDWAEFNKKNRVGAKDFATGCPFAHIVILKVCMDPILQQVMAHLLHTSSQEWDLKNLAGAASGKDFRFRLLDLSRDAGLGLFFNAIRERLFDSALWSALPSRTRSTALSTWAFRLLSPVAGLFC